MEEALLGRLREWSTDLHALLAKASNHWGFENPVYRFYHYSRKVFHLQAQTEAIVAVLFLEMAVRYSSLDAPPMPLPSGYAALLHLYGLR